MEEPIKASEERIEDELKKAIQPIKWAISHGEVVIKIRDHKGVLASYTPTIKLD